MQVRHMNCAARQQQQQQHSVLRHKQQQITTTTIAAPSRRGVAPSLAPARASEQITRPSAANWKVFGPTAEYSDGDADFYRLTSQLSDQYEWFAPRERDGLGQQEDGQQQQEGAPQQQQRRRQRRPEFGLSPREIQALGLSGTLRSQPDPVRVALRFVCVHAYPLLPA
jgi:hypothetical protein